MKKTSGISRRQFVKISGITAAGISSLSFSADKVPNISLIVDPDDSVAGSVPVQWALKLLQESLVSKGMKVQRSEKSDQTGGTDFKIFAGCTTSPALRNILSELGANIPMVPEALGLVPSKSGGKQGLVACGTDERGLVYALLELNDRIQYSSHPPDALILQKPVIERPSNVIRSVNKLFVSDVEDKPWYNDRGMWPHYLTMLATQRFNRFHLSFGIGYDFLQNVTDGYFLFAYPFFLSVPGFKVRVPQLPDSERDSNLQMLKYISEQTVARGMHFQLGIWMHGYEWLNSPNPNYTIEGLSPESHGSYCRAAIRQLLQACPAIGGVTFRIHGESGVTEGSYQFWKSVFDGVATCGRRVEIDMHAKGMDQQMIDLATATGLKVNISPKYWAEHLGMSYHQADIRPLEIPKPGAKTTGLMNLSAGSRSFIRYGYGDLLKEKRPYGVIHRIWPGTQRLLLWGDPAVSAAHSRAFSFCGSSGVDLMEPLSFKGRRGSGIAGNRCGYADSSLVPRWDWEKYLYSYRIFGRLAYNPETDPEVWTRYLTKEFGKGAKAVESALANASRILPIVLTSHGPSAANNSYWPEMYTNQSIVDVNKKGSYSDTLSPKVFGYVSPFDPQLFLRINDFAEEILKGDHSGKYSPVESAQWIEDYAEAAARNLAQAESRSELVNTPVFRRMAIDVSITIGLGRFFGAKFRAGVLYAIFEQTGERQALEESLKYYQKARAFWAEFAGKASGAYLSDITVGEKSELRGHWLDRLPAIDEDIVAMIKILEQTPVSKARPQETVNKAIKEIKGRPARLMSDCHHIQPERFKAGLALDLSLSFSKVPASVRLYYRHISQAERFEYLDMQISGQNGHVTIPAEYTNSPYPLQYYFELKESKGNATLYPGFASDLMNQPYFIVRQA